MRKLSRRAFLILSAEATVLAAFAASHTRLNLGPEVAEAGSNAMKSLGYDIEGGGWPGLTEALAVERASEGFDGLVAQGGMYKKYVSQMHAANPGLILWAYANGSHTSNSGFPEKWYMHDSNGTRLRSAPPWDRNFTMMPIDTGGPIATINGITASSWNAWSLLNYERIMADCGYDGIYVDELGTGSLTSRAAGIGESIDPRTNQPWDKTRYMQDIGVFLGNINTTLTNPVACNGLGSNYRFYGKQPWETKQPEGATAPLLAADHAAAELYMRGPTQDINKWPRLDWWQAELKMTQECGPKLLALTKTWVPATSAQIDHWHRFSLATFLLGSEPNAYYYFTAKRAENVTPYHSYWTHAKTIGTPLAAAALTPSGLYRRRFTGGFVLVNPTQTPIEWSVGRTLTLLDGSQVSPNSKVTMNAYEGQVFRA